MKIFSHVVVVVVVRVSDTQMVKNAIVKKERGVLCHSSFGKLPTSAIEGQQRTDQVLEFSH